MAKVEVGMQLSWQGRPVICTSIKTTNETLYARKDSLTMRTEMSGLANVKVLAQQWDDFDEGDIVSISLQRLELTEPGKNIYFIYAYYRVKREVLNDSDSSLCSAGSQNSEDTLCRKHTEPICENPSAPNRSGTCVSETDSMVGEPSS